MAEPTRLVSHEVTGIALLLWAAEPEAPHRLVTPFFHAAAAAAMNLRVEIYFTARSVLLLKPGVALGLRASDLFTKTVYHAMQEAVSHGAVLLACTDALHAQGMQRDGLIPECSGHGGAVQFMARVADPAWRSLVF
ncbi:DsrE family protein [Roseateles koreensis]|uniref:DsrE family protein n=1 Tax=Roseateles koreensis TaxID=2987526 RepID=A0ABT5KMY8_9BURK|nr:DsrE family protein [Roseateles koreensis]MDC8783728.1 DsrE family protein [Roseateles koreensis]